MGSPSRVSRDRADHQRFSIPLLFAASLVMTAVAMWIAGVMAVMSHYGLLGRYRSIPNSRAELRRSRIYQRGSTPESCVHGLATFNGSPQLWRGLIYRYRCGNGAMTDIGVITAGSVGASVAIQSGPRQFDSSRNVQKLEPTLANRSCWCSGRGRVQKPWKTLFGFKRTKGRSVNSGHTLSAQRQRKKSPLTSRLMYERGATDIQHRANPYQ